MDGTKIRKVIVCLFLQLTALSCSRWRNPRPRPWETPYKLKYSLEFAVRTFFTTCSRSRPVFKNDSQNPRARKRLSWRRWCVFWGKIQDPHRRRNAKHERRLSLHCIREIDEIHGQRKMLLCLDSHPLPKTQCFARKITFEKTATRGPIAHQGTPGAYCSPKPNPFSKQMLEKKFAKELHHFGLPKYEAAIKQGGLAPGGFQGNKGGQAAYLKLVNSNPDTKHKVHNLEASPRRDPGCGHGRPPHLLPI